MNIFFLSMIPSLAAKWHCDKHVVKMVLEAIEVLYSVNWVKRDPCKTWIEDAPLNVRGEHGYPKNHIKHPSIIWACESEGNYLWLCDLAQCLHDEYNTRYGKIHAAFVHIQWLRKNVPIFSKKEMTKPKIAMTPACKEYAKVNNLDAVEAYQHYYITEKLYFVAYRNLEIPPFLLPHFSVEDNYARLGLTNQSAIDLYKSVLEKKELSKTTKEVYGVTSQEKEDLLRKAVATQLESPKKWNDCAGNGIRITNAVKRIIGKEVSIKFTISLDSQRGKKRGKSKAEIKISSNSPPQKKPKITDLDSE